MRTFAQTPKVAQQTTAGKHQGLLSVRTFAQAPKVAQRKSAGPVSTHLEQSRETTSLPHLRRTAGNQPPLHSQRTGAGGLGEAGSLASPRFGHDLSRTSVNDRQLRVGAAPGELAFPRSGDMEGPEEEEISERVESVDQDDGGPPPTPQPAQTQSAQAPAQLAGVQVTVPSTVRAASTPAGVPDRIPPRIDTPVAVTVTGWHAPWQVVTFSVEGGGGGNGTVTINGANSVTLTASATLQLRGVNQTNPGNAGNLRLVAHHGSVRVGRSNGFSVSSVPQNWSTSLVRSITGSSAIGMIARNSWQSDSGNVADLDEVRRSEQVEVTTATGPYAGATQGVSSWKIATTGSILDNHRDSPRSAFRAAGSKIAKQVFIYKCARTAVTDIPATNSGLLITRNITSGGSGVFNYDISKVGSAVTANGFRSAAASGSAVAPTQVV